MREDMIFYGDSMAITYAKSPQNDPINKITLANSFERLQIDRTDKEAAEVLYRHCKRLLPRIYRTYWVPSHLRDDLLQESIRILWSGLSNFDRTLGGAEDFFVHNVGANASRIIKRKQGVIKRAHREILKINYAPEPSGPYLMVNDMVLEETIDDNS